MKRKQYPQPASDSEMVKEPMPAVSYNHSVSPLDALWSIYQSQSKRVRKAFRQRILEEEKADKHESEMRAYELQLPSETRESVRVFTNTIKKAVNDVRQAAVDHTHVGRNADDFLSELEQEEA
jgi:hypothetical protein